MRISWESWGLSRVVVGMKLGAGICWLVMLLAARADWEPLFNGKDLSGWGGAGAQEYAGYVVEEGILKCTPKGKILATEREFADYILEFEFQLTAGANNGLGIHYSGQGNPAFTGMELQILDNSAEKYADLKPEQFHGSLYSLLAAERGHLKPVGEWNFQRVTVRGERVCVELNGVCILDTSLVEIANKNPKHEGAKRRSGKIALCGHGDMVSWRNVRIAELSFGEASKEAWYLPPGKKDDSPVKEGFTSLFDGKTLTGWRGDEKSWLPKEGWILSYDGKSEAEMKDLWTEKSFRDFTLVCDWRWLEPQGVKKRPVVLPNGLDKMNGQGEPVLLDVPYHDSGVYLRGDSATQINMWAWPIGSGEVYGIRTKKEFSLPVRAGVTPRAAADRPIGEWNRFVIEMKGERVTVYLNGECVLHEALLPGVKEEGPFALQHHGVAIELANIYVKEW